MFQITVCAGQKNITAEVEPGTILLDALRKLEIFVDAECNGRGTCGKCIVFISSGVAMPTPEDLRCLTKEQLESGMRLACCLRLQSDLTLTVIQNKFKQIPTPMPEKTEDSYEPGCQIAVDLGSTTLAAVLLDQSGKVLARQTGVNSQRIYGADILSRIQAAVEGHAELLRGLICKDLLQMFLKLSGGRQIQNIAIAGNTTMLHLLRGYPCEGLGRAPFHPYQLQGERLSFHEVFEACTGFENCKVYLLPGLSAFVGADITAGLYSSGFLQTSPDQTAVFVDLGTNGELAVGCKDHFLVASTAAGPAFEGGGLSCGMPGVPGAICQVSYLYHRVRIRTIGQKKPCGICGTGALEAVAALRGEGLLDENGLLSEKLFDTGMVLGHTESGKPITLTQEDIRAIQLAKAAVRAGIETLCYHYQENMQAKSVDKVYLAGGFGYYLSEDVAFALGLFPKEWREKLVVCANTSLDGAISYLIDDQAREIMEGLRENQETISLSQDSMFARVYLEQMIFPKL